MKYRYAEHAMEVWRAWVLSQRERGWPAESSEVRAYHRAQTATRTDGEARYTATVEGLTVRKEPPPMPKETRPSASSRVPDIDMARLGPRVDRHLQDLEDIDRDTAAVVQAHWLMADASAHQRAAKIDVDVRRYWDHLDRGMMWLEGRMSLSGALD